MKLSVVIATYNSEEYIENLLKLLTLQEVDEVIVSDKGSTDSTVGIARQYGADICRAPYSSLGDLWNAGFSLCSNEVVWFLEANSKVPVDAASLILDEIELGEEEYIGGYFKISHSDKNIIEQAGEKISHIFSRNIAETGIFILTTVLYALQGFPDSNSPVSDFSEKLLEKGKLVHIPRTIEIYD